MDKITKTTSECREMISRGDSIEQVMAFLRKAGFSKVQSIRILVDAADYSLSAAKKLVHSSAAWADLRTRDDRFHDDLIENLSDNVSD